MMWLNLVFLLNTRMREKVFTENVGIYKLTCIKNNKIYIGKSVNLKKRIYRHKNCLKDKTNSMLQRAIQKYGWESFHVEILEYFSNFNPITDNNTILDRERYYINLYNSTDTSKGYNICKYSNDRTGIPLTTEHKNNISRGNKGKHIHSEEFKERMRQRRLGSVMSEETKEKLRIINKNKKLTQDHKNKIGEKSLGRKLSEESKEKISRLNFGRKRSDETKEKMRLAKLGKKRSKETLEKIKATKLRKLTNLTINQ